MIRAVVFDFDGLILETEEPWFELWQDVFRAHGQVLAFETYAALIGTSVAAFDPYRHLEERTGRPIERESLRREMRRRYDDLIRTRPVQPGVDDYLSAARRLGLGLAVASSSDRAWVHGHLGRLGLLDRFDAICCAEDVERVKPDPALYLLAAERLSVEPREAIAIEDSPNGITAARRAGLYCVAVPNALTTRLAIDVADLRLASLVDMPLDDVIARANALTG